ncbi:endonuclease III [Candidatus Woesearchaeota archaeon]|nr:endonuclease III [Candidatus Woesearchaeota archaeon]
MVNQKNIVKTIQLLKKEYPEREFPTTKKKDPYYVLVSCILSLRTKDEVTYPAAQRLFDLAKTPEEMIELPEEKIKEAIYPVGFYNNKTETIRRISKRLVEECDSKVPDTIEELLKFKGIGRKTANIVITQAFDKLGIAVDTHVNRIPNRLGWIRTKNPGETEKELKKIVPEKYWIELNELLVKHGQNICTPISPKCSECIIEKYCKKVGVNRSR